MIKYVCGFYFTFDFKYVTLIEKLKPEWQKGKLNGVGGKIEPGEGIIDAMVREMKEETGIETHKTNWINLIEKMEKGDDWRCYFLCAVGDEIPVTMEKEVVNRYLVSDIENLNVIDNLKHIIPAAIQELKNYYNGNSSRGYTNEKVEVKKLEPKPGMNYFLTYEIPATITSTKRALPKGTVVTDVKLVDGHYHFIVKDTGVDEHTYYGWALAEHTYDNLERLTKYDNVREAIQVLTNFGTKLRDELKTLEHD